MNNHTTRILLLSLANLGIPSCTFSHVTASWEILKTKCFSQRDAGSDTVQTDNYIVIQSLKSCCTRHSIRLHLQHSQGIICQHSHCMPDYAVDYANWGATSSTISCGTAHWKLFCLGTNFTTTKTTLTYTIPALQQDFSTELYTGKISPRPNYSNPCQWEFIAKTLPIDGDPTSVEKPPAKKGTSHTVVDHSAFEICYHQEVLPNI